MDISDCKIISLPKIPDQRGNLSFIEAEKHIPFNIQRVYWVYDVPGGEIRGGHAYKRLREFFVALSGSFDVVLNDGMNRKTFTLNRSYFGLYVPNSIWRHMGNFSTNAVCMVVASGHYAAEDYIRDYASFMNKTGKDNH